MRKTEAREPSANSIPDNEAPVIGSRPDAFTSRLIVALGLDRLNVAKIELRIGPRSQTAVATLKLTAEQVAELNALATSGGTADAAA